MSAADKVREAASALAAAISQAQSAGYVVTWPRRAVDLPAIAVSATARALESEAAPAAAKPASRARPARKTS